MNAIIIILSILFPSITYGGFAAHTPVMLPSREYTAINNIRIGDMVLCHDNNRDYVAREVIDIRSRTVQECVCVVLKNTHIITAHNQKFYLADQKRWRMAGYLLPGDFLLSESGESIPVKHVLKIPRPVLLYDLTVQDYHNFLVSRHGIVVHNFAPVVIGAAFAFGGGVELTNIIFGVGGLVLGTKGLIDWFKNRREQRELENMEPWKPDPVPSVQVQQPIASRIYTFPPRDNNTPSRYTQQTPIFTASIPSPSLTYCPPNPSNTLADAVKTTIVDSVALTAQNVYFAKNNSEKKPKTKSTGKEEKKDATAGKQNEENNSYKCPHHKDCIGEHPEGAFGGAPYHHGNSKGNQKGGKSPAPKNGQKALDSSKPVEGKGKSKRRISVSDGEIVVLDQTQPGLWHGHVRQWHELEPAMKKTVIEQGWTSPKGKIFK